MGKFNQVLTTFTIVSLISTSADAQIREPLLFDVLPRSSVESYGMMESELVNTDSEIPEPIVQPEPIEVFYPLPIFTDYPEVEPSKPNRSGSVDFSKYLPSPSEKEFNKYRTRFLCSEDERRLILRRTGLRFDPILEYLISLPENLEYVTSLYDVTQFKETSKSLTAIFESIATSKASASKATGADFADKSCLDLMLKISTFSDDSWRIRTKLKEAVKLLTDYLAAAQQDPALLGTLNGKKTTVQYQLTRAIERMMEAVNKLDEIARELDPFILSCALEDCVPEVEPTGTGPYTPLEEQCSVLKRKNVLFDTSILLRPLLSSVESVKLSLYFEPNVSNDLKQRVQKIIEAVAKVDLEADTASETRDCNTLTASLFKTIDALERLKEKVDAVTGTLKALLDEAVANPDRYPEFYSRRSRVENFLGLKFVPQLEKVIASLKEFALKCAPVQCRKVDLAGSGYRMGTTTLK